MQGDNICVAGIDPSSGESIRPVVPMPGHLHRDLLAPNGPLALGAVVSLGPTTHVPDRPHVEDYRFDPRRARRVGQLSDDAYFELIDRHSASTLRQGFGRDLRRASPYKYAVDLGQGECSLACVKLRGPVILEINQWDRLQLRFESAGKRAYAGVTDLRFFEADGGLKHAVIDDVGLRLRTGVDSRVMFGLARPWKAPADDQERSWLQVNGICLEDDPLGP